MKGIGKRIRENRVVAYFAKGKRWLILFLCLLLAGVLWMVQALEGTYTKSMNLEVAEIELPSRFAIIDESQLPKHLLVEVSASGRRLLQFTLNEGFFRRPPRIYLDIDTLQLNEEGGYWMISDQELQRYVRKSYPALDKYFEAMSDRLTIRPEVITFNYLPMSHRTFPIVFGSQFDFGEGTNLFLKSWDMNAEEVTAYGVVNKLDSIANRSGVILTDTSAYLHIEEAGVTTMKVPLLAPEGVRLSSDSVEVSMDVQELKYHSFVTEELEERNLPNGLTLRLFPSRVTVTLLTPAGVDIGKIKEQLRFYVDLQQLEGNSDSRTLKVFFTQLPNEVHMIQLEPDELEYIVEEEVH